MLQRTKGRVSRREQLFTVGGSHAPRQERGVSQGAHQAPPGARSRSSCRSAPGAAPSAARTSSGVSSWPRGLEEPPKAATSSACRSWKVCAVVAGTWTKLQAGWAQRAGQVGQVRNRNKSGGSTGNWCAWPYGSDASNFAIRSQIKPCGMVSYACSTGRPACTAGPAACTAGPAACTAGVPLQHGRWRQRLAAGTAGGTTPGGPRGRRPVQRSLQQRQKRVAQPVLQLAGTLGLQVEQDGKVAGVSVCRVVGWRWGQMGGRGVGGAKGMGGSGKEPCGGAAGRMAGRAAVLTSAGCTGSRVLGAMPGPAAAAVVGLSEVGRTPVRAGRPAVGLDPSKARRPAAICLRSGQPVPQAPPDASAPTALPAALPSRGPRSSCKQGQPCPPPLPSPHPTTPLSPPGTQPAAGRRSGSQSRGCAAPGEGRGREGPRGSVRAGRREVSGRPQRDCGAVTAGRHMTAASPSGPS